MSSGTDDDICNIKSVRKSAMIDNELHRLNVDIAALQETRLADQGSTREKHYTFFWHGKPKKDRREHGVGFAVRNTLAKSVEIGENGSERVLSLRLRTSTGCATLVSAYAPTLCGEEADKDEFYEQLHNLVSSIPERDHLILLGDFNARVGDDHVAWGNCLGKFGYGKMNSNGQRLLELCSWHKLCVTNSFFHTKQIHKVSWRHPRSKAWHQLDLILVKKQHLNDVKLTRSYHSACCDSDHSLVCCKIRLSVNRLHKSKEPRKARLNTSKMYVTGLTKQFASLLAERTSSGETTSWTDIRETVYKTALDTFGKKSQKSPDWFEENLETMLPLIEHKRHAHLEHLRHPSPASLVEVKASRAAVQRTARRCANDFWLKLSADIQTSADTGNMKAMYDGLKRAFGPSKRIMAPISSSSGTILSTRTEQMERWVEHFSLLYSRKNVIKKSVLDSLECKPTMYDLDKEPTIDDLRTAIKSLSPGKACGNDGIPPDLLRQCKESLLPHLYQVFLDCWRKGTVPQDMKDSSIITLYKNKGVRHDCNNHRGISLLSIVGKTIARAILPRLQKLANRVYPESQCGFRPERSTIDMIFSVRQIQEKCREQQMPLHMAFIDLTKAFDLVSREGLLELLLKIGCPPKLLSIIKSFHTDTKATVQFDGSTSEPFDIHSGVKQGCVLAPTLFGIFFSLLLNHAFGTSTEGVFIHTRSDGNLFKPSRLKSKRKIKKVVVRDLLFADDAAIVAHSANDLQNLLDRFSQACDDFGLTISKKKTKVINQGVRNAPSFTINGEPIENVEKFVYLGSTIAANLSLDAEIDCRLGKAYSSFARLAERVWNNPMLTIKTKSAVYSSCVLSTLLYASESWTTSRRQESKLNSFHFRCLRRILGITWRDHVTNVEVLRRTGLPTMFYMLKQRRLRWLGHVFRMEDGRYPKDLLYSELGAGSRKVGRPALRFSDVIKRDLKDINIEDWEAVAGDRARWRSTVKKHLLTAKV